MVVAHAAETMKANLLKTDIYEVYIHQFQLLDHSQILAATTEAPSLMISFHRTSLK